MAFAANVSKPKTISKTRAGSSRTVELKGPLPKAMNIGDGTAKKCDLMGTRYPMDWPGGPGIGETRRPRGHPQKETTEPSPCLVLCRDLFKGEEGHLLV